MTRAISRKRAYEFLVVEVEVCDIVEVAVCVCESTLLDLRSLPLCDVVELLVWQCACVEVFAELAEEHLLLEGRDG